MQEQAEACFWLSREHAHFGKYKIQTRLYRNISVNKQSEEEE